MPTRFISATTCSPNGVSPPLPGSDAIAESAQLVWLLCVSVM